MKKVFAIALFFIAFNASAQIIVPGQEAHKYLGQTISTYGYVYKIEREPKTRIMIIEFGSKFLAKGVTLRLRDESKLEPGTTFQTLVGRFITVTGKIIGDKAKPVINGEDPATIILMKDDLALN